MKKSKLLLAFILAAILLGFSACGGADAAPQLDESPHVDETIPQDEPPYDYEGSPEYDLSETPSDIDDIDWSLFPIIIDGSIGVAANWHTPDGEDFPTHIPLMPVAEGLGVISTVTIDDMDPQIVTLEGLNGIITFAVGSNEFTVDGSTVELWQPSLLIDGEIYVPILFFRDVYGMGSAMWTSGHVYLDTHGAGDMY